jgi:prephenate dehydratase
MIYRKKLDEETEKLLKRNINPITIKNYNLTKIEENKLKAVFWGTNFTTDDILKGIREKNQKILKKIEENLPLNLQKQILGKLNYA